MMLQAILLLLAGIFLGVANPLPVIPTTTPALAQRQLVTEWCQPWPSCGQAALESAMNVASNDPAPTATVIPVTSPAAEVVVAPRGINWRKPFGGNSPGKKDRDFTSDGGSSTGGHPVTAPRLARNLPLAQKRSVEVNIAGHTTANSEEHTADSFPLVGGWKAERRPSALLHLNKDCETHGTSDEFCMLEKRDDDMPDDDHRKIPTTTLEAIQWAREMAEAELVG